MKPLQVFLLSKLSSELGRRQHGSHCWTTRSAMMPWLSQDRGPSHLAAAGYSLEDDSEDEASSVEHLELEGSQGAWDWVSSMRPKHETPSHQIAFTDLIFSGHILGQGWAGLGSRHCLEAVVFRKPRYVTRESTWEGLGHLANPAIRCGGGLDNMELGVAEQRFDEQKVNGVFSRFC